MYTPHTSEEKCFKYAWGSKSPLWCLPKFSLLDGPWSSCDLWRRAYHHQPLIQLFYFSSQVDVLFMVCWIKSNNAMFVSSILKVKLPLQLDLHMHQATGAPYWPILACGTSVQVKTRYFEKFKINISIQTKFPTRKCLNTRSNSLILTCGEFRRVQEIFKILLIWNTECLAKWWVKYMIVLESKSFRLH